MPWDCCFFFYRFKISASVPISEPKCPVLWIQNSHARRLCPAPGFENTTPLPMSWNWIRKQQRYVSCPGIVVFHRSRILASVPMRGSVHPVQLHKIQFMIYVPGISSTTDSKHLQVTWCLCSVLRIRKAIANNLCPGSVVYHRFKISIDHSTPVPCTLDSKWSRTRSMSWHCPTPI